MIWSFCDLLFTFYCTIFLLVENKRDKSEFYNKINEIVLGISPELFDQAIYAHLIHLQFDKYCTYFEG
jgi:hypothetical protein